MLTLDLVLLVVAFVCALLAALGVTVSRLHLGWAAVALYLLTLLV